MYCRNCGKRMESNDDFCMDCKAVMFDKMNISSAELNALLTEAAASPAPAQQAPAQEAYAQAPVQETYTQVPPAAYTQVPPVQGAQQVYTQVPPTQGTQQVYTQVPPVQGAQQSYTQAPGTTPMPSGGYVQWGTPAPSVFGPMTGFGTALASAIVGFFAFIFSIVLVSTGDVYGGSYLFLPCAIVSLVLGLRTLISVMRLRKRTGYTPKLALAFSIVGIAESGAAFLVTGIILFIVLLIIFAFAGL